MQGLVCFRRSIVVATRWCRSSCERWEKSVRLVWCNGSRFFLPKNEPAIWAFSLSNTPDPYNIFYNDDSVIVKIPLQQSHPYSICTGSTVVSHANEPGAPAESKLKIINEYANNLLTKAAKPRQLPDECINHQCPCAIRIHMNTQHSDEHKTLIDHNYFNEWNNQKTNRTDELATVQNDTIESVVGRQLSTDASFGTWKTSINPQK